MLEVSLAVKSGDIVTKRGGKIIRCGGRMKPIGVFSEGRSWVIMTLAGEVRKIESPCGVVTGGYVQIGV